MKLWTWLALLLALGVAGMWLISSPLETHSPDRVASLETGAVSLANNPVGGPLEAARDKSEELKIYRWKDGDDKWSLANLPPPEGTSYEVIDYTPQ